MEGYFTEPDDILEGEEAMDETLEEYFDDEFLEEVDEEYLDGEGEEGIEEEEDVVNAKDSDSSEPSASEDTVVGVLEVSELNEEGEEPVLVREDEENDVLGVEDGLGGQFLSKLFGGH